VTVIVIEHCMNGVMKNYSDALLYYYHTRYPVITGAILDAFEYYIAILEHNKDFKFIFLNMPPRVLEVFCNMVEDRYELSDLDYRANIIRIPWGKQFSFLTQATFNRLLVLDYGTIPNTRGVLRAEELIVLSDLHTEKKEFFYSKDVSNAIYYGEMPYVYKDFEYNFKFLFHRYKKIDQCDDAVYLTSPKNDNVEPIIEELKLDRSRVIIKSDSNHCKNLFSCFDTFIYYHANTWFDPRPRLFVESAFYEKKIQYYNSFGVKDGSWYRYNDVVSNGISHRYLDKDDEVVSMFSKG